jgi:hypothetical protein
MSLTLYEISILPFIKNIKTLQQLLQKGVDHASDSSKAITEEALLESRLIADMGNLIYQSKSPTFPSYIRSLTPPVQRVSDTAKGVTVRVGKSEPVSLPDTEKTFPELQTRLAKTIEILEAVDQKTFNENDATEVIIQTRSGDLKFTGKGYILNFAIPNFYFHFVTAYDLLRKEGVDIGKSNYMGRF